MRVPRPPRFSVRPGRGRGGCGAGLVGVLRFHSRAGASPSATRVCTPSESARRLWARGVTFGNGLIATFVAGYRAWPTEREIPDAFVEFNENRQRDLSGRDLLRVRRPDRDHRIRRSVLPLLAFILSPSLSPGLARSPSRSCEPRWPPRRAFMGWFGPKGVGRCCSPFSCSTRRPDRSSSSTSPRSWYLLDHRPRPDGYGRREMDRQAPVPKRLGRWIRLASNERALARRSKLS